MDELPDSFVPDDARGDRREGGRRATDSLGGETLEVGSFLLAVLRALHTYGMPAHRLEDMGVALSRRLGAEAHIFSTPTALFVALGTPPKQRTFLLRANSGEMDLARLGALDRVANEVAAGTKKPVVGAAEVEAILAKPPREPLPLTLVAHAVVAAGGAVLLGGRAREAAVAAVAGISLGAFERLQRRSEPLARLQLPLAAALSALLAGLATWQWPQLSRSIATIAGILVLLPGLTLTTAMNEIATGHLVSGTARFSKALMSLLLLGFGAALGAQVADLLPHVREGGEVARLGAWETWGAFGAALLGLSILLKAPLRDAPYFAFAAAVTFLTVQLASPRFGAEEGAAAGAFVLGICGNASARWRDRPAAIVVVPGLLLLVPGSLGFRSVTSFLADDVLTAVGTAFDVTVVAVALVGGLLVAALALPPRKAL
ncbi:MAG: threonine/serine exporter family protein [Sandaracinus sp.]|nr:threonine/serine exporter family protein [Sandaracinus sp.]MCB9611458.1 threonine/serine exporter family protein [Sandaracinus sp.]MCB9620581.1 threonine/serine exporter family protein [Sandaracinus sp.]MCB9621703.1 threonine/serine exporter family protein [Sandaracinus sp.]